MRRPDANGRLCVCARAQEHVTPLVDLLNVPLEKLNYKEGGGGPDELISRSDAASLSIAESTAFNAHLAVLRGATTQDPIGILRSNALYMFKANHNRRQLWPEP
ncbi:hypothetical protein SNK05_003835 [Fusarium graminearum]